MADAEAERQQGNTIEQHRTGAANRGVICAIIEPIFSFSIHCTLQWSWWGLRGREFAWIEGGLQGVALIFYLHVSVLLKKIWQRCSCTRVRPVLMMMGGEPPPPRRMMTQALPRCGDDGAADAGCSRRRRTSVVTVREAPARKQCHRRRDKFSIPQVKKNGLCRQNQSVDCFRCRVQLWASLWRRRMRGAGTLKRRVRA